LLSDVAATAPIEKPAAEDLAMRQRTLPEQKELLRGLGQTRPAAEPTRPGVRAKPAAARVVRPAQAKTGTSAPAGKTGP
jgi:hypothetical protein